METITMQTNKQRIGIMGGTFDPIHIGHLITAEFVRTKCNLDSVLFIPAGSPPHKQGQLITPAKHRFAMTVIAAASNPCFKVLPLEIERCGLSYTIDTVRRLLDDYGPATELFCITGADAIRDILTWKDLSQLLDLCWFIAASRPGSMQAMEEIVKQLGKQGCERILRVDTPQIDISATQIRERLRQGASVRYLLPENVIEYINHEHLYK
jgi:nicotinate-nucleotide adenylyltransferase